MRTTTDPKEKALQARVSQDLAERIALIAKAQGKSTSELIRDALKKEVEAAENDLRNLRNQLRQRHLAEERKLGLLPEDMVASDPDVTETLDDADHDASDTAGTLDADDEAPATPQVDDADVKK
ncbi:ribbon-helix-helix protein, CopG family [Mycolicibacterium fortuitum]|uniref:ribbon-helix-helix protein, CopG family n=1 Tax=Mycolicibacterium fortuitum TaxID=1766 RepID=UPI003AAEF9BF